MNKTFTTMKTNCGNMVQDTSSIFATIIGTYLNDKYRDLWRRILWSDITNDDYTFTSVLDQAQYDLPSDFEEELFVQNITTNNGPLTRKTIGQWWRDRGGQYASGALDSGTPNNYVILKEVINSSGNPYGAIKLDPPCDTASETYAMPYKRRHTDLLGTTGTCTTDTASKIVASASTFITDGVEPGMRVKNTTDSTYGIVASVDSETELTMDSDLCPDGDESFSISNLPLIGDISWIMELGAIGEALAYKRQMQKADYFLSRYEKEVRTRISQERSQTNQRYQNVPQGNGSGRIRRFSGDKSYDSI